MEGYGRLWKANGRLIGACLILHWKANRDMPNFARLIRD